MLHSILGRKVELYRFGAAIIACVYMDGAACYGEFISLEGVRAWVHDNILVLDQVDTVVEWPQAA